MKSSEGEGGRERRDDFHVGLPPVLSSRAPSCATAAPLREESIPIHGIRIRFDGPPPARFHVEPGGVALEGRRDGDSMVVEIPPLERHAMLVAEWPG